MTIEIPEIKEIIKRLENLERLYTGMMDNRPAEIQGDHYMGKQEVMAYLGWSHTQWTNQLKNLPITRVGGNWKIKKSLLDKHLNTIK